MRLIEFLGIPEMEDQLLKTGHCRPQPASEARIIRCAVGAIRGRVAMARCTCIHLALAHCPTTGACLVINPTFGPCPCDAIPPDVLHALWAAHYYTRSNGHSYEGPNVRQTELATERAGEQP